MEQMTSNPVAPVGGDGARLLWCELVSQLGWETEESVRTALDELQEGLEAGYVDRQLLGELRRSLQRAKQIGTASRQIACIAAGSIRQTPRRTAVADLLRQAFAERSHLARSRKLLVDRRFVSVDVVADRDLVALLMDSVVAWAMDHADRSIQLTLEREGSVGRVRCRFKHRRNSPKLSRFGGPACWGASWQLVRHASEALNWSLRSGDDGAVSWLSIDFPHETRTEPLPAMEVTEVDLASVAAEFQ